MARLPVAGEVTKECVMPLCPADFLLLYQVERHGRAMCGVLWSSDFHDNFFWMSCEAHNRAGLGDPLAVVFSDTERKGIEEREGSTFPVLLGALGVTWSNQVALIPRGTLYCSS